MHSGRAWERKPGLGTLLSADCPPLSDLELQLLSMRIPSPARLLAAIGGLLPLSPQPTVQIVGDVYLDVIAKVDELPSWDGDTTIQSPIQTVAAPQHAQTCGSARAPAAPAQDALGGSRERPGHGAPSHCLGRVSQLPPSSSQLPPSAASCACEPMAQPRFHHCPFTTALTVFTTRAARRSTRRCSSRPCCAHGDKACRSEHAG